ncbi:MAG: response regulator transcription factor [Hyphomicrobium sp.]
MTSSTTKTLRILIVEDDAEISTTLQKGFEAEGFAAIVASNSQELFKSLKTQSIDLITLDLGLESGKVDGLDLTMQIRSQRNIPIIIVTGRNQPIDRVAGLEKGADDYITKPFLMREAAIRIRTVAERYGLLRDKAFYEEHNNRCYYLFSEFILDPMRREIRTLNGAYVPLTETQFNLLEMLLKAPQRVLSRDEMMMKLRNHHWDPLSRGVDGHIARLRSKIEAKGEEAPRLIKSVRNVGYVFAGKVSCVDPENYSAQTKPQNVD